MGLFSSRTGATAIGRHVWIPVLVGGVGLFVADQEALVATSNPNFVPSVILLGASVVPVSFLLFVYSRRLSYDAPKGVVAATFLVGGVLGTVVAGIIEYQTLKRMGSVSLLGIGLIEEAAKLIVPLAVLLLLPYRRPADGLLIGVASGAGFAALETMGYAFVFLIRSHGDVSTVDGLLVIRGLLSPAGHMAWTGISAAALWEARTQGWSARGIRHFVFAFVFVSVLHAVWDGTHSLTGYAILAGISLGMLVWVTHRAAVLGATGHGRLFRSLAPSRNPVSESYGRAR